MQKYQSIISGTNGSVIRNVPVTVLKEDGSLAEIFMDREGQVQAPNPLVTDSRGVFYFYAKNGRYSLRTAADGVQITDADTVLLFDPDETASDGPIAGAVRRAEDAAVRAETALSDSGLQTMVQDAQDASANAAQAVIEANLAVASIDAALIEAGEAKEAAQAAAQIASNAASGAQAVKDSLLTYSGTLSATPEWSAVPAHEDLGLDAQTQAALNRVEKLKDDQQLLKQRADKSVLSYPDYATASAAAATLPDGQKISVPNGSGQVLCYVVQGGELTDERLALDANSVSFSLSAIAYAARTVAQKISDIVDLRDFGAIGDNVAHPLSERFSSLAMAQVVYPFATSLDQTIDWAAAQAAINYAESLVEAITTNYDLVRAQADCGNGHYVLGQDGLLLAQSVDGVQLVGRGAGATSFAYSGSGAAVTAGTETGSPNFSHVWLRDLTLRGGIPPFKSSDAAIVPGSIGFSGSRLIRGCGLDRVQIFGFDTNTYLRDCWTFKIRDCHMHDAGTHHVNWQTALNGEITGSRFDDSGSVPIIIDAQGASNQIRDFRFVGNTVQESGVGGVRFIDVSSAYCESNHFENNNQTDSGTHSEIEFITGSDNRIDGTLTLVNNYYSPGAATWTKTEYAVRANAAKQVTSIGEKTGSSAYNAHIRAEAAVEHVEINGAVYTNMSGSPVSRASTATTINESWTKVDSAGVTVEKVNRTVYGSRVTPIGGGMNFQISASTGSLSTDPTRTFFNMAGNNQTLTLRSEEEIDGRTVIVRKYSTTGQLTVTTAGASLISLNGTTNNNAVLNAARGTAIFVFDGTTTTWVCMPLDEAGGWALSA